MWGLPVRFQTILRRSAIPAVLPLQFYHPLRFDGLVNKVLVPVDYSSLLDITHQKPKIDDPRALALAIAGVNLQGRRGEGDSSQGLKEAEIVDVTPNEYICRGPAFLDFLNHGQHHLLPRRIAAAMGQGRRCYFVFEIENHSIHVHYTQRHK